MEIRLPFEGFYESWLSQALGSEQEQEVERLSEDHPGVEAIDIDDLLYRHAEYHKAHLAIAKAYVGAFQDWLETEYGVKVELGFIEMTSPKEYNFTTDNLYATISYENVKALLRLATWKGVAAAAKEQFTSRSGFTSFYSPRIETWGKVVAWDSNQTMCILDALVKGKDIGITMYYALESEFSSAFDGCVDWKRIEAGIEAIEEDRPDDWDDFPHGIVEATAYVEKMAEIRHHLK